VRRAVSNSAGCVDPWQLTEVLKQARRGNDKQLTADETRYLAKVALSSERQLHAESKRSSLVDEYQAFDLVRLEADSHRLADSRQHD
jgi:hypothetical protein